MVSLRPGGSGGEGGAGSGCGLPTSECCICTTASSNSRGFGRGDNHKTLGPVKATSVEVSSTERIPSQTIELSGMIHRRPLRVLLDSGSTGNYISDQVAQSFNLMVQSEEGTEQLTLADGSKVQA